MKYYVNSFYNYGTQPPIDYTIIGSATEEDEAHDGENWCGRNDAYRFDIYNSLSEAIENAGSIANKIQYEDLSVEEMEEAHAIVEKLMCDKKYLAEFS